MAFEFRYAPSSTGTSTQVGFQGAVNRRKNAIEDQQMARQNAFSQIIAQSTNRETGELNAGNAFAELARRGMGAEAMALRDTLAANAFKQAQIEKMRAPELGNPTAGQDESGNELFFRTDKRGGIYDLQNKPITTPVRPRPQKPLVDLSGVFEKEAAKKQAESYQTQEETAATAQSLSNIAKEAESLLPQIRTGAGAGAESSIGSWMSALGKDPTKWGLMDPNKAERFEALANNGVGLMRTIMKFPASGFSDADREMLEKASFGLGKNPQANLQIIHFAQKVAEREQLRLQEMDKWIADPKHKGLTGFNAYWVDFQRKNPISSQMSPGAQQYKVGDLISGKDGKRYVIKRLDPSGDHDVELVK